ncbi:flavin reductase family protein [Mycobacterium sp. OTB74]|uniref:flavin reductase family protein n=1 Tax=Mycobacterium sp. OTB74 TaxID=1853452 RepID=UPI0024753CCE|nr:flavin reductase family protein [Mycobacterium sp. OTB74]MDH6244072.1 flavin reductase (DIM6/NTAB) family NADH-FMN oxidoreductase RutF [Mycobacterium sp. OTB74]
MIIDPTDLNPTSSYKLLIGSVLPRAIAWVSTQSTTGVGNIAPVSFFTVVGRFPPILSISLQPRSDEATLKDTFINIRDTGNFVINIASLAQADALHRSAFEFDSGVDEFEALGLQKVASEVIDAPRIADAPISFECVVDRIIPMPPLPDHVVWGRVKKIHVRDDLYLERGRIDTGALHPFGRLAAEYTAVDNIFTTPIPDAVLADIESQRIRRLDGKATDFSPIDTSEWSPSGSVSTGTPQ